MTEEVENNLEFVKQESNSIETIVSFMVIALIIYGVQNAIGVENKTMNLIIPTSISGIISSFITDDPLSKFLFIFIFVVLLPIVGAIAQ